MAWTDDTSIFFRRSDAGGAGFLFIQTLASSGGSAPSIATSGDNVYVVWSDSDTDEIVYRRSTDRGATFGPTLNLSNSGGPSDSPAIAVSDGNVYVVWIEGSATLLRRSTDGGGIFGPLQSLGAGPASTPSIAASGKNVYLVSTAVVVILPGPTVSSEIIYRRSTDNGATFGPIIRLSNHIFTNIPGSFNLPDIAASGNNVYAVWVDESGGNREIYYIESSNGGATFGPTQNVSNNPRQSTSPSIAGSNQ